MIAIAADHGGFALKEEIKKYLDSQNIEYKDLQHRILRLSVDGEGGVPERGQRRM